MGFRKMKTCLQTALYLHKILYKTIPKFLIKCVQRKNKKMSNA